MYITYNNGIFEIADSNIGAVVNINPPIYVEDGFEKTLAFFEKKQDKYLYCNDENRVEITIEKKNDNLFYIHRRWKNISEKKIKIQTVFRISECFNAKKYLIPCVNFNGNQFGDGNEPKGLDRDGKKWIFAYDRVSIPSCTLTENKDFACALFTSAEDRKSLESSCSIFKDNGVFYQEIYHPVIEAPVTYSARDTYNTSYEGFIELEPMEYFESGMYISVSKPKWKNYGIAKVLDSSIQIFGTNEYIDVPDKIELWNDSIAFAKSLITEYKDKKGFIIGYLPDGNGGFAYRKDNCFELAWCGQNILLSRMLIEDYIINGNKENLDIAIDILDTRIKYCRSDSGLLASQLKHFENIDRCSTDTCNLGYGAYEILKVYQLLKKLGIEKNEYFNTAKGVCDFFCEHFSEEYGFGKRWSLQGKCMDTGGTIGAFLLCALAEIYALTGNKKYLDIADRAMEFYVSRDLDEFCCTAGALDTCCVDKETSLPFILSGIILYETTKNKKYLEYAEKAAYYFTSWMFHYEPQYDEDSEVCQYKVYIKGLTSVSTQHHHLDPYAAIAVPYISRISKYTGDGKWKERSEMMWRAAVQCIGNGKEIMHNIVRPRGSQNEAVLHCRWGLGGGKRGKLNDWLVAWPCAFRLSVLADELNGSISCQEHSSSH